MEALQQQMKKQKAMHAWDREWSDLPADILSIIARCITNLPDFIHFSRVCTSWRSAAIREKDNHGIKLPLMIFIESNKSTDQNPYCHSFFSLSDHKSHMLNLPKPHRKFVGSSLGWLITIDDEEDMVQVNLVNPVTGETIPLVMHSWPPTGQSNCHPCLPWKVVLSSSPAESECVAMATLCNGRDLVMARPGDMNWTLVRRRRYERVFEDIVYHQGKFYVYESYGGLIVCDYSHGSKPVVVERDNKCLPYNVHTHHYLVSSEGKAIFLVDRSVGKVVRAECRFLVYKWDGIDEASTWEKVETLGGRAFFLGSNSSICLSAIPEGCERDCIYFTSDSNLFCPDDMGVYSVEDGSTKKLYPGACNFLSRPTWLLPRF